MNVNPMLDYHLIDIIEDLTIENINFKLRKHKVEKVISSEMLNAELEKGKTQIRLVEVNFKEFVKKYKKQGVDKVYNKFKKSGIDLTKENILDMYEKFIKIKEDSGKNYDSYIFFV